MLLGRFAIITFLIILILTVSSPQVFAQEKHIVIRQALIPPKVLSTENWNFTVNLHNSDAGFFLFGGADVYLRFYLDGQLWSQSNKFRIAYGGDIQYRALVNQGISLGTHTVRIEAWWDDNGVQRHQDTVTGSFFVVSLSIQDWTQDRVTVQRGRDTATNLIVRFRNGGNDLMSGIVLSVLDSRGLAISPASQELGDASPSGIKTTSFGVSAPASVSVGSYTVTFRIAYKNFRQGSQIETKNILVEVTNLATSITLNLPSSTKIGETVLLSSRLMDGNNSPAPGLTIRFLIKPSNAEQRELGTAVTDASGNAALTTKLDIEAGSYIITAQFAGSQLYAQVSTTGTMLVNPLTLTVITSTPNAPIVKLGTSVSTTDASGKVVISVPKVNTYTLEINQETRLADGVRAVFVRWSDDLPSNIRTVVMNQDLTLTAITKVQNLLAVKSNFGEAKGAGWHDSDTRVILDISSPIEHGNGTKRVLAGWSGTDGGSNVVQMDKPKVVEALWKTQYLLIVVSPFSKIAGGGWYESGSAASLTVNEKTIDQGNNTRRTFEGFHNLMETTIVMSSPKTVEAKWKTQYLVLIRSEYGSLTGGGWYDRGSPAKITVQKEVPMSGILGTLGGKFEFNGWTGGFTSLDHETIVLIDGPKDITAKWSANYFTPSIVLGGIFAVAISLFFLSRKHRIKKVALSKEVVEELRTYPQRNDSKTVSHAPNNFQ
ncbi:MAG: hypothetical protein HYY67_01130 [Thaumarchaeota archaeon]|nr:hypothetical protein [Nitrososphaerota archaeon]